ncbi:zinc ribbon domain-containing protein YjdM [Psychroflexus lacisalsi]|jgi:protein PhnA|nr:zinc ribbon domain-containing protein YjdM [Psychroflexus lacisalsi]
MSEEMKECPNCKSPYGYSVGQGLYNCPECSFEWNIEENKPEENEAENNELLIKDANGNVLEDGDNIVIVKDLPVKGFSKPLKAGTKVKNIRLTDGDHNIDCKIKDFGAMALKSEFVKKA